MRRLSDDCHAHGTAVMIQLTHLGRRTAWNKADWLPVLAPSPVREPAHRAFPKAIEDWDIERIIADYAAAAQRMQAAGLDGIEIEAYGHLPDQFWSPATNHRDRRIWRQPGQPPALHPPVLMRCAPRPARVSLSASAWSPTRTGILASRARRASRSRSAWWRRGRWIF